jgi:hypothetical protein
MNSRSLIIVIGIAVSLLVISLYPLSEALAQEGSRWTFPSQIPDYDSNARAPYMVADSNRTVHSFNVQIIEGGERFLYYRQWTLERGWTLPVDIIIPPRVGTTSIEAVVLDGNDNFHLVFYLGDNITGGIYYSTALAAEAGRASSWSQPVLIGDSAGPVGSASLIISENEDLILVYAGKQDGIGLYEVLSFDGGETWTSPQVAVLVFEDNLMPSGIGMVADTEGRLYLVWSLVNIRGLGEAVYFSSYSPSIGNWRTPIQLASLSEDDYSTNWPSIVHYRGELIVIYQDSRPATRFMRRSYDAGETWTPPVRPFPHEGEYEYVVLLEDSAGVLHMILGNRIGNPEIHGMWHSRWLGERWSILEPIISGPRTSYFDPSAPIGVVSQGKVLLVAWWNNVSTPYRTGGWFSYLVLDAPEQPVVPLSTPVLEIALEPTSPTMTQQPVQTVTPLPLTHLNENPLDQSPAFPVFASIAPAGVLVSLLVIGFWIRRKLYNH